VRKSTLRLRRGKGPYAGMATNRTNTDSGAKKDGGRRGIRINFNNPERRPIKGTTEDNVPEVKNSRP